MAYLGLVIPIGQWRFVGGEYALVPGGDTEHTLNSLAALAENPVELPSIPDADQLLAWFPELANQLQAAAQAQVNQQNRPDSGYPNVDGYDFSLSHIELYVFKAPAELPSAIGYAECIEFGRPTGAPEPVARFRFDGTVCIWVT